MREILFRGQRKDNGEWVSGRNLLLLDDTKMYIAQTGETGYTFLDDANNIVKLEVNFYSVIPETVGQFTGLLDKNGTEIFEGDIVRHGYYNRRVNVVEYSTDGEMGSCGCCYDRFVGTGFVAYGVDLTDCYVIGNIHDNPELLEVTNER